MCFGGEVRHCFRMFFKFLVGRGAIKEVMWISMRTGIGGFHPDARSSQPLLPVRNKKLRRLGRTFSDYVAIPMLLVRSPYRTTTLMICCPFASLTRCQTS